MVGEADFNVPAVGSEQMYQALRYLEIPTQLVIYPDQHHSFTVPSYEVDALVRHLIGLRPILVAPLLNLGAVSDPREPNQT